MNMPEVTFISSIGTLGKDRKIINIPKKYHREVEELRDKEIIVTIREALPIPDRVTVA
jgi:hypothetical protein